MHLVTVGVVSSCSQPKRIGHDAYAVHNSIHEIQSLAPEAVISVNEQVRNVASQALKRLWGNGGFF